MTTEDIAAAAGISISTYFRHAPTKEGLLVAPVRHAAAEVVAAYSARPPDESAAEALIQLFVEITRDRTGRDLEHWQQGILTAPHLLTRSPLISENDHHELVRHVAARMSVDSAIDVRAALLVHTSLATA